MVRGLPFHCTTEEGTKFEPLTVKVNAAVPTITELGLREVIAGAGLSIGSVSAFDVPPPGAGVTTVTAVLPVLATSAAVMDACRLELETKVVARELPFH